VELTQQKNYQGDGDSVFRLFYETVKEEIIVHVNQTYRLAEVSANIIDQCVSGSSFVSMEGYWTIVLEVRLFLELYAKGQTGQQLL
jgi:succinate dehydrogenase / fumarate reductase flavoprotein subunit